MQQIGTKHQERAQTYHGARMFAYGATRVPAKKTGRRRRRRGQLSFGRRSSIAPSYPARRRTMGHRCPRKGKPASRRRRPDDDVDDGDNGREEGDRSLLHRAQQGGGVPIRDTSPRTDLLSYESTRATQVRSIVPLFRFRLRINTLWSKSVTNMGHRPVFRSLCGETYLVRLSHRAPLCFAALDSFFLPLSDSDYITYSAYWE